MYDVMWFVVCVKWCNLFHYKDRSIIFPDLCSNRWCKFDEWILCCPFQFSWTITKKKNTYLLKTRKTTIWHLNLCLDGVRENRRKQKIFRSHEKFHTQLLRTATKFFKIFERKECELILGYRLKLYLLIIIGATDSSSGLDGGSSKETVDCHNKRWIKWVDVR